MTDKDGRKSRGVASRDAILKACRAAMRAGMWRPIAEIVAALSGRSRRTVYEHFADLPTLHREALEDVNTVLSITASFDELSDVQLAGAIVLLGYHPQWPDSTLARHAAKAART